MVNAQVKSIEVDHPTIGKQVFNPVQGKISRITNYNYYYLSYSLFAISGRTFKEQNNYKIDDKLLEFGDSAVFIKDTLKFLKAIEVQLKKEGVKYEMRFVEYIDYEKEGEILIEPFNKKTEHSHQMEFRIIIENTNDKARFINIGSIAHYSQLLPSKSMIEIDWKAKKENKLS